MPETKCYAQVRGSVIRVTRLDACGNPVIGSSTTVVSKKVSTVTIDEVTEDGENIRDRNFGGELCIVDDVPTQILGYTGEIALCGVDPDLINIFTGQAVVLDAEGNAVGFGVDTGVDLDGFGFAVEVWSRLAGQACEDDGNRPYGYTVFPFFKGGRIGGFSFENASVNFTITGAQTQDGNGWGVGPYDVVRDALGDPSPLLVPLPVNRHWQNQITTLAPPAADCGAVALADGS